MKEDIDIKYKSGDKYNQLTLTGKAYINNKSRRYIECICTCGNISFKHLTGVLTGHIKSCGCRKRPHGMSPIHGKGGHPLYSTWMNMKTRCYQKSHRSYQKYGGIGLTVCDEWLKSFKAFFNWAFENGWEEWLSIDRIENDKGYYPENCRWATEGEQSRNKRYNINLTAFGETKCLTDWINDERCVVSFNTVRLRMTKLKWDAEKALSFPNMNDDRENGARANSIKIEYNGEVKCLKVWCKILGLKYTTIRNRVFNGWDAKRAFETTIFFNKIPNTKNVASGNL